MKSKLLQMVQDEVQSIDVDSLRMPEEMFRVISINLEILTSCYIIKKWGKLDVERLGVDLDHGTGTSTARLRIVHTHSRKELLCDQFCAITYNRFVSGRHAGWKLYLSTEVEQLGKDALAPSDSIQATWYKTFDMTDSVSLRYMRSFIRNTRELHLNRALVPFLDM